MHIKYVSLYSMCNETDVSNVLCIGLKLLSFLQVCLLWRKSWAPGHGRSSWRSAIIVILYWQLNWVLSLIQKCHFCICVNTQKKTGGFSVAFDPLDGSSIVDTNFTVGTIFGVWPGDKLTGITGRDQVAAAMGVLGPRTTYVLALKDFPGTHEFLLLDEGQLDAIRFIRI